MLNTWTLVGLNLFEQWIVTIFLLYRDRAIGIFYNSAISNSGFRTLSKLMVALAWILALFPLVPGAFEKFGRYGVECKTRKCTVINMDSNDNVTTLNPKRELGRWCLVLTSILLLSLNIAIVLRLRVSY